MGVQRKYPLWASIVHFLSGLLCGFYVEAYTAFSVGLLVLFLIYEVVELVRIRDLGYKEILEFSVGFVLGFFLFLFTAAGLG